MIANAECSNCGIQQVYFEIWFCDKNPQGLNDLDVDHGNEIEGTITCEDDYCRPDTRRADEIDEMKTKEESEHFVWEHEGSFRCSKCHSIIDPLREKNPKQLKWKK